MNDPQTSKAIDFLHHLVKTPSLSGDESGVAQLIRQRMTELGFRTEIDAAGNVVGRKGGSGNPKTPQVMLLGHMDTVPGGPPCEIRGRSLYGRGSVDAKGSLATFVEAIGQMEPEGLEYIVIGAVEEEAPTSKGAHYVAERYHPMACVIGEPSGVDAITLGYKGFLRLDYRISQPTAHTAGPDPSAAERAIAYWNAVQNAMASFNEGRPKVFEQVQGTIVDFHTHTSETEEHADVTFKFRLPAQQPPEAWTKVLEDLNQDQATLEWQGALAAYQSTSRTPLAHSFVTSMRTAGVAPRFKVKTGTSDLNVVGPRWQVPIVAYGPGDSALDHTPQEHLDLDEYLRAIDILKGAMECLQKRVRRTLSAD